MTYEGYSSCNAYIRQNGLIMFDSTHLLDSSQTLTAQSPSSTVTLSSTRDQAILDDTCWSPRDVSEESPVVFELPPSSYTNLVYLASEAISELEADALT